MEMVKDSPLWSLNCKSESHKNAVNWLNALSHIVTHQKHIIPNILKVGQNDLKTDSPLKLKNQYLNKKSMAKISHSLHLYKVFTETGDIRYFQLCDKFIRSSL